MYVPVEAVACGGLSVIVYVNDVALRSEMVKLPLSSGYAAPCTVTDCPSVSAGDGAAGSATVTSAPARLSDDTVDVGAVMPNDAVVMFELVVAKGVADSASPPVHAPLHVYRLRGVVGLVV